MLRAAAARLSPARALSKSSQGTRVLSSKRDCLNQMPNNRLWGQKPLKTKQKGIDILHDPLWNKGMAFDYAERDRLNLRGLLPPRVKNQDEQVARIMEKLRSFAPDTVRQNMYLQDLHNRNETLYHRALSDNIEELAPLVYTPTVGEACQKFGLMPAYPRGCYVSLSDRGRVREVLEEYARAQLAPGLDGKPRCDCIVFSDGGRILGLGDLAAWGMGIPIGKLDLYTVCGGFDPARTIPVILDAGCFPPSGNSAGLDIRGDPLYTGTKEDRTVHTSEAGTQVNSFYYGPHSFVGEFMGAAAGLFGPQCLLQFEDFNSNDAFPLLAQYREQYLTYNDDIQVDSRGSLSDVVIVVAPRHLPHLQR